MGSLRKTFHAVDVGDGSDGRWAAHLRTLFPQAEGWLTDEGRTAVGALRARKLFEEHMPELVPLLDRLAEQVDRPGAGTFLTMAALKPFFSGCTQTGSNGGLLRNYDFPPEEDERTTRTQQRLAAIRASGGDVSAMLRPPLYESQFDEGYGTLYTADYQPKQRRVTYHWPGETWEQSFADFVPGTRTVTLG